MGANKITIRATLIHKQTNSKCIATPNRQHSSHHVAEGWDFFMQNSFGAAVSIPGKSYQRRFNRIDPCHTFALSNKERTNGFSNRILMLIFHVFSRNIPSNSVNNMFFCIFREIAGDQILFHGIFLYYVIFLIILG